MLASLSEWSYRFISPWIVSLGARSRESSPRTLLSAPEFRVAYQRRKSQWGGLAVACPNFGRSALGCVLLFATKVSCFSIFRYLKDWHSFATPHTQSLQFFHIIPHDVGEVVIFFWIVWKGDMFFLYRLSSIVYLLLYFLFACISLLTNLQKFVNSSAKSVWTVGYQK